MNTTFFERARTSADRAGDTMTATHAAPVRPEAYGTGQGWRRRARPLAVALLAALLAVAAAGLVRADGREADLRASIDSLTEERDDALASVAALDDELASLRARAAGLSGDLTERGEQIAELERRIAEAGAARDAALADLAELQAALDAARAEADQAIADRDAVLDRFPVRTGGDLADRDVAGRYAVAISTTYCSASGSCSAPRVDELTIATTPEGFLRLRLPGFADAGLLRAGAALHTVTDTTTTALTCGGAPRPARVSVTLLPATESVDADGGSEIATLGAVITVDAPATATCAPVLAVYSADLTPR